MSSTVELLSDYMKEHNLLDPNHNEYSLFTNRDNIRISRFGVRYILDKYVAQARKKTKGLNFSVTPHTFRHSKAMHLYESGIPLSVIANILGHVDVNTTLIYAKANLNMKRKALEQADDLIPKDREIKSIWTTEKGLMEWLTQL